MADERRKEKGDGLTWRRIEPHGTQIRNGRRIVREAPRDTPVAGRWDVVVAGGGPSGVGAALAAAEHGASVLVVERHGMLGGMWTAGLVNPFFEPYKGWIVDRLIERLKARGAWRKKGLHVFDVEHMKYVLERMAREAGVEFWYHCQVTDPIVEGDRVVGMIVQGKSGREAVLGKIVVDCTGDGDVAARAGVPFQIGRPQDGACQPMTLMFEITGFEGLGGRPAEEVGTHGIIEHLERAIEEHGLGIELPYGPQRHGTPAFIALPADRVAVVQATHVYRYDATDTRQLTRASVEAREQVHEVFLPALRKVPGLENVRLSQTAPQIGIRESRRLEGQYHLDLDDVLEGRRFEDAVTGASFPLDVHEIDPDDPTPSLPEKARSAKVAGYDIPYRCLVPREPDGLLFAGRCISGSHHAHASYRVTGVCMATGQAAGLAAARAATRSISPRELDGTQLHQDLAHLGVRFEAQS